MIDEKQAEDLKSIFDELMDDETGTADFSEILDIIIASHLGTARPWCLADQQFAVDYLKKQFDEAKVKLDTYKNEIESPGVIGKDFNAADAYSKNKYPVLHSTTPTGNKCDLTGSECYVLINKEDCRQDLIGDSVIDMLNSKA